MDVRTVQRSLKKLGFDPGPIDGIWGRKTSNAVQAFQEENGLPITGLVDPRTEREIAARAGKQRSNSALVWFEEAQRLMGLQEVPGGGSNQTILDWAEDLDINYPGDDIPWCGLFVGHCVGATLPREPLPNNPLGARNWLKFGKKTEPEPGAILVFWRGSRNGWKGHVGFYESEDSSAYHVLGGNQSDSVRIARVAKSRLLGARWPTTALILNDGPVSAQAEGELSTDES
jgi:uncharacterized protein (TIGR02594 family)